MSRLKVIMKNRALISAFIFLAVARFAATASGQTYSDRIAAVVNGEVILYSDVEMYKNPRVRELGTLPLGVIPPGKWPTEKEILDELIVMRLLEQEAKKRKLEVGYDAVERTIEDIAKRNNKTKEQFMAILAKERISPRQCRELLRRQFTLRRLLGAEVTSKVPLREEDAQRYFKANQGKIEKQFDDLRKQRMPASPPREEPKPQIPETIPKYVGGRVHLKQITLSVPHKPDRKTIKKIISIARKIRQEVQTGARFSDLARKYSADAYAKSGGDLGYMNVRDLRKRYKQAVELMEVGDVSQPIPGVGGLVILYLADAKGRKLKKIRLTEKERRKWEREWRKEYQRRKAEFERMQREARARRSRNPVNKRTLRANTAKPVKDLGILSPEEAKEYKKVRDKVYAILRSQKIESRMKEWIQELKKNAIIEVRL